MLTLCSRLADLSFAFLNHGFSRNERCVTTCFAPIREGKKEITGGYSLQSLPVFFSSLEKNLVVGPGWPSDWAAPGRITKIIEEQAFNGRRLRQSSPTNLARRTGHSVCTQTEVLININMYRGYVIVRKGVRSPRMEKKRHKCLKRGAEPS